MIYSRKSSYYAEEPKEEVKEVVKAKAKPRPKKKEVAKPKND